MLDWNMEFQLFIKAKMLKNRFFLLSNHQMSYFIMLINVKMPTVVGILTLICMINNFMLSRIEHEKRFMALARS